jgi:hypothetical protein
MDAYVIGVTQAGQAYVQYVEAVESARLASLSGTYGTDPNTLALLTAYKSRKVAEAIEETGAATHAAIVERMYVQVSDAAWKQMADAMVRAEADQAETQAEAAADWIAEVAAADRTAAEDAATAACEADKADNSATAEALVDEADANKMRTLAELAASREADEQDADDDLLATTEELDAYLTREKKQIDNHLTQALADATNFVNLALAVAQADKQREIDRITRIHGELPETIAKERDAMIATARLRIKQGVEAARARREEVAARPDSYYEQQLFVMNHVFDGALGVGTDFFAGWANSLTFGGYMGLLGDTTYLNQVNPDSTAFMAGEIVGAVHQAAIGVAAGSGPCQVGYLIRGARVYSTIGEVVGIGKVGIKAWTQGIDSLNFWD